MTRDFAAAVRSQFGPAAADYATSDVHAKGESLARIVELANPRKSWATIDIATGAGHTAVAFAPHVATVIATDITDEMLTQAEKLAASRGIGNLTTARAEASTLPFADASFDLVTCRLAAHHFPDLARFIREMHRVLKPGGRLALVDNVAADAQLMPQASLSDINEAVTLYNQVEKLRDPSHGFAPPPETWIELLSSAQFSIVAREQFGKELDFASWVARMRCPPDVITQLRALLQDSTSSLVKFLRPRVDGANALYFTLQELLVVAEKSS